MQLLGCLLEAIGRLYLGQIQALLTLIHLVVQASAARRAPAYMHA